MDKLPEAPSVISNRELAKKFLDYTTTATSTDDHRAFLEKCAERIRNFPVWIHEYFLQNGNSLRNIHGVSRKDSRLLKELEHFLRVLSSEDEGVPSEDDLNLKCSPVEGIERTPQGLGDDRGSFRDNIEKIISPGSANK